MSKESVQSFTQEELLGTSEELEVRLRRAAQQGFFYVEMPEKLELLIGDAVEFAHKFYKDKKLKNIKMPAGGGYKDWEKAQAESFFCERSFWGKCYPEEVVALANSLINLSEEIFGKVFPLVAEQLPKDQWSKAVGDLFKKDGSYHFSFNHYRPTKKMIGVQPHRDFGYITLLFINKEGLRAKIDNEWCSIPPKKGYFVVNFGRAFEILVNDSSKLIGNWHYVEQIPEEESGDRISFGLFSDNKPTSAVCRITADGELEEVYPNYGKYLEASLVEVDQCVDILE